MSKLSNIINKERIVSRLRPWKYRIGNLCGAYRSNIIQPFGTIPIEKSESSVIFLVGPHFNQTKPDAMMTSRMGYANAFEAMGVPYVFLDLANLNQLDRYPNPLLIIYGSDYIYMSLSDSKRIRRYKKVVWVDPWFRNSKQFFENHNLDAKIWTWSQRHRDLIIQSDPSILYTATVESGLSFFEEWTSNCRKVISLPLALDTETYQKSPPYYADFKDVDLAFVGGYWASKGQQIDKYLRPFEKRLTIYGYNKWPYSGYKGQLPREKESSLYHQAKICPVVNEPTVGLLKGQINERVFKVLGSYGLPIVDGVSCYRELFDEDELLIPNDHIEFVALMDSLLKSEQLRSKYKENGYKAVLKRHTYIERVRVIYNSLSQDD